MRGITVAESLIFQTLSAGFGTLLSRCFAANWLPRFHRAGPSTSLDEHFNMRTAVGSLEQSHQL
jgi:hypothetical protein